MGSKVFLNVVLLLLIMKYNDFLWFVEATTTQRVYFILLKNYLSPQNRTPSYIAHSLNISIQSVQRILTDLVKKEMIYKGERRFGREYAPNVSLLPALFEYSLRYYCEMDLHKSWPDKKDEGYDFLYKFVKKKLLEDKIREEQEEKPLWNPLEHAEEIHTPYNLIEVLKNTKRQEYNYLVSLAILLNSMRTANSSLVFVKIFDKEDLDDRFTELSGYVNYKYGPEFQKSSIKVLNSTKSRVSLILMFLTVAVIGVKRDSPYDHLGLTPPTWISLLSETLYSDVNKSQSK